MNLLKKENWWIWLLLFLFSEGTSTIVLGAMLDVFDKKAWYAKWYIWLIGVILILPISFMIVIFNIQISCLVAAKLDVKGQEYYLSPYVWIILLIIPILGWIVFVGLILYLTIATLVKLHNGNGEKYI